MIWLSLQGVVAEKLNNIEISFSGQISQFVSLIMIAIFIIIVAFPKLLNKIVLNLSSSLQVFDVSHSVYFLAGDDVDLWFFVQVVDDEEGQQPLELMNWENIHFVSSSKQHFVANFLLFYRTKCTQIFSVYVFLLPFFDRL